MALLRDFLLIHMSCIAKLLSSSRAACIAIATAIIFMWARV